MSSLFRTKEAKFVGLFVSGNLIVFCLLLSFAVGIVWSLKKDIAEQSAEIARNSILSGNYRETADILQQLNDRYAISSGVFAVSGRSVLSIGKPSSSFLEILPLFEHRYTLFLDVEKKNPAASIVFTFAPYDVLLYFLSTWILFLAASVVLLLRYFKTLKATQEVELEHAKNAAIASTTQALAHDIRKPFSMFKMIIDAVEAEADAGEARLLLQESLPEVQSAMASVNGLIQDVMEIGSDAKLVSESAHPELLVENGLTETIRLYPEAEIGLTYEFRHSRPVQVDIFKIGRVFSNIFGNAVQAMRKRGEIWVRTTDLQHNGIPFVQFCIGNGGSFIPGEHLTELFDAFFTSGKKGGTGLGLAIAHKIVTAHGGRIWCESRLDESNPQGIVEFYFTVPAALENAELARPLNLANKSSEFLRKSQTPQNLAKSNKAAHEIELELELIKHFERLGTRRKTLILLVDDEQIYRSALTSMIPLEDRFDVKEARNKDEAEEIVANDQPEIIILDIDLGCGEKSGLEFLTSLRARGFKGFVCVHSNRSSTYDFKTAISAGANSFLPKPMSRIHLQKMLIEALSGLETPIEEIPQPRLKLGDVAILDDSKLTLRAWKKKLSGQVIVHVFTSPSEFWHNAERDPGFLGRLELVITDYYFDASETTTGLDFAENLKKQFKKPIFLSSDGEFSEVEFVAVVDKVISKEPVNWDELKAWSEPRKVP